MSFFQAFIAILFVIAMSIASFFFGYAVCENNHRIIRKEVAKCEASVNRNFTLQPALPAPVEKVEPLVPPEFWEAYSQCGRAAVRFKKKG